MDQKALRPLPKANEEIWGMLFLIPLLENHSMELKIFNKGADGREGNRMEQEIAAGWKTSFSPPPHCSKGLRRAPNRVPMNHHLLCQLETMRPTHGRKQFAWERGSEIGDMKGMILAFFLFVVLSSRLDNGLDRSLPDFSSSTCDVTTKRSARLCSAAQHWNERTQ